MDTEERKSRQALQTVLDIGAQMLSSGAEISRVEDSIISMCHAFGAEPVECFAITYVIVVTISGEHTAGLTEIRRIRAFDRNMYKLTQLNALSREICETPVTPEQAAEKLREIESRKSYSLLGKMGIFALISLSFTLFFGGSIRDMAVSALIGILIAPVETILSDSGMNRFVQVFLCSAVAGFLSIAMAGIWRGVSSELVSIGNITIFIPGVIFTCAIQEIFSNNMLSGLTRLGEAVITSLVIATGFVLVNVAL